MLKLFNSDRSSASFRVRIALNIKKMPYQLIAIDLSKGEQYREEYLKDNPQGLVPVLWDETFRIAQSLAILEYLEEKYPSIPLLPKDFKTRAKIRECMQIIACEIQPSGNLSTLNYLKECCHVSDAERSLWIQHWIDKGFIALETLLVQNGTSSRYCFGDVPSFADVCLIPQVFNAKRFGCDLNRFPRLTAIADYCMKTMPFIQAAPQP